MTSFPKATTADAPVNDEFAVSQSVGNIHHFYTEAVAEESFMAPVSRLSVTVLGQSVTGGAKSLVPSTME